MKTKILLFFFVISVTVTAYSQSWSPQVSGTTASLKTVYFVDANTGYAAGSNGTVVKTTDAGVNWTPVNINSSNSVNGISFISADTGWAVTSGGSSGEIWKTTDGGANWTTQIPSTTEARFSVAMANSSTGWVVGARNGPINIDYTNNGGDNWVQQSNSNIFGWLYDVKAVSSSLVYSIGGAFFPSVSGFIIKSVNGGTTWTQLGTGTLPFLSGIDFPSADTGYVVGEQGTILGTKDGGTSWTPQSTTSDSDDYAGVSFINDSVGWVCGSGGKIISTLDGGANWMHQHTGISVGLNDIFAINQNRAWAVGGNGTILTFNPTGIKDLSNKNNSPFIYPNPFSEKIFIAEKNENRIDAVEIRDVLGRIVYSEQLKIPNTKLKTVIHLSSLSDGIYMIKIKTRESEYIQKIIKQ